MLVAAIKSTRPLVRLKGLGGKILFDHLIELPHYFGIIKSSVPVGTINIKASNDMVEAMFLIVRK